MSIDHAFDDLYDLDDLHASEAWFDAASSGLLDESDPLGITVAALLGRLDREVAGLAPVSVATEDAIGAALRERASRMTTLTPRAARVRHSGAQVRRSVVVMGLTATLFAAAAGVAAASPGSWLFPVRQLVTGQSGSATPEDLATASHILDLVELDIRSAQNAGGINDVTRRDLAARLGVIHDVIDSASGADADALRGRWTRDDLVLIALPRLGDGAPSAPAATGVDDPVSASPSPLPSLSPASSSAPAQTSTQSPPTSSAQERLAAPVVAPGPRSTGVRASSGSGEHSPTPSTTPSPSESSRDGNGHSGAGSSPDSGHTHSARPSSDPSTGAETDD